MAGIHALLDLVALITERLDDGTAATGLHEPIQRGSAEGFVSVEPNEDDPDELLLVVRLRIMDVPDDPSRRGALFSRLLGLNHDFRGRASFSTDEVGVVWLTSGRPLEDLDPGEVVDLLLWTSEQADFHDDRLLAEFGDP
jgi:hypothetical protein